MANLEIRPNRVIFSNGLFDSDKQYIKVNAGGNIYWPSPYKVTLSQYRQPRTTNNWLLYKNGIGGVPAYYTGDNHSFRCVL